ncbi:hypothetical protein B0H16DRAFT_1724805 [Mycena metata]|uniref:Uncharacterized protein n=1 Tax=Mycena metata TaxID=1033252 RepID=A0AAD7IW25_9AGAR|nr:hypothetical protein B0H16DRAFT_1724805 [Mycena metata]
MPPTPNATENRLKSIAAYLEVAVGLVNDAAQVFEAPFLLSITKATSSLIHCIPANTKKSPSSS